MNPFADLDANFDQNRLNPPRQSSGGMGFSMGPQNASAMGAPTVPKKKEKNFWVDQISTVTGTAGGILGGIAGAAGGAGIGAVPGMVVGGAGGSAIGEALENILTGDNIGDNVVKEAALGGLFSAGPVRLAKTALGARAALNAAKSEGAELGLKSAIRQGSDEAMKFSLRGAAGKHLTGKSKEFATKQFGFTDNFIAKYGKTHKEDPGKTITRLGIGSIDDIEKQIASNQEAFDALVRNANPVNKDTLRMKFAKVVDDFVSKAPSDQKKLAAQIQDEVDQMVDGIPGDQIPATMINQIRKQYDSLVNYAMKNPASSVPYKTDVNKELARGLRESLQEASGSKQLKETGAELSKLYTLQSEALARAPQVASRASSPLGFRNLLGMGVGGSVGLGAGGPVGALVGAGAVAAANSAPARRMYTKGAVAGGEALTKWGAGVGAKNMTQRGIMQDQAQRGLARGFLAGGGMDDPTAQAGASSIEDALMQSQFGNTDASAMGGIAPDITQGQQNMGGMVQSQDGTIGMPQQPQSANPYSREALIYDINRDPANADKYIAYFQQLDEIFGAPQDNLMPKLNNTAVQTITDLQTGLDNLGILENKITTSSSNAPVIGDLRSMNPFDTDAKSLRAEIDRVRQVVGKALEGGVLRKEDEEKYARILPTIGDTDEVARQKISAIRSDLQNKLNSYYVNQAQFGSGGANLEDALMAQQGGYF